MPFKNKLKKTEVPADPFVKERLDLARCARAFSILWRDGVLRDWLTHEPAVSRPFIALYTCLP